jgi:hypothetical protein
MTPRHKSVTRPNPEALAALVSRLAWFFAQQDVKREMEKAEARKRTVKAPRRRSAITRAQ